MVENKKEVYILLNELTLKLEEELKAEIEFLGGTLDVFDPENEILHITVDPQYEPYVEKLLVSIFKAYYKEREKILKLDKFDGVKEIIDNQI